MSNPNDSERLAALERQLRHTRRLIGVAVLLVPLTFILGAGNPQLVDLVCGSLVVKDADGKTTTWEKVKPLLVDLTGRPGPATWRQGTFAPGEASKTVTVAVNGDTRVEANESFKLVLTAPANALLGAATATGTILNDDAPPNLSVGSLTQSEGNSGTRSSSMPILSSAPAAMRAGSAVSPWPRTSASLARNCLKPSCGGL